MRAMILAAGRGDRMRPLTDFTPKPLLKVGGKPLIIWHLERLAIAGFKEIVINHAHLGQQIEQTLGNGEHWGVSIQYSSEKVALETAGGIANALHLLGEEAFLVVNGDIFTEMDFATLKLQTPNLAHLVMVNNPLQHPQGDFAYSNSKGRLQLEGASKMTFSGVGIYHPDLFADVVPGQSAKLAPLLKSAILNERLTAEHYEGEWRDIGTPERLQALNKELLKHHYSS
ncbi:MAG: nucleotidyltransferase family protein [Methylotenera sp.]|nr:nucleotidyltransferase family protein [Methylotenera sp.]